MTPTRAQLQQELVAIARALQPAGDVSYYRTQHGQSTHYLAGEVRQLREDVLTLLGVWDDMAGDGNRRAEAVARVRARWSQ